MIFIYLNYNERRKLANIFTLTLKFHNVKLNNVIKIFIKFIQNLNHEMKLKINNNIKTICAFDITFFKNISQQANNEGFIRHNIKMNYYIYFYFKKERKNLNFNIINQKKYH